MICNQAASFNRCLFKGATGDADAVEVRGKSKGKGSSKASEATDELQFLMNGMCGSITQAVAKAMEHLTDFVFITMGNITLARRAAYLTHQKNGVKPDTLAALRTGLCRLRHCSQTQLSRRLRRKLPTTTARDNLHLSYTHGKGRYHPYERVDKKSEGRSDRKQERPAWKNTGRCQFRRGRGKSTNFSSRPAKGQQSYK